MENTPNVRMQHLANLKVAIALDDGTVDGMPVVAGNVIIRRRGASRPFVYGTIYDALRSRLEIAARYGIDSACRTGEFRELDAGRRLLDRMTVCVLGKGSEPRSAVETLRSGFSELAADFRRKRNPAKSSVRMKAAAGPVVTERGALNPSATLARIGAIDRRIELRESEIRVIAPWMRAMETSLLIEIDRSLKAIREARTAARTMRSANRFFRDGTASPSQRRAIAVRLELIERRTSMTEGSPFRRFGTEIAVAARRASDAVLADDDAAACDALDLLQSAASRALLQKRVEDAITIAALGMICNASASSSRRASAIVGPVRDDITDAFPQTDGASDIAAAVAAELSDALESLRRGDLAAAKAILKSASRQF